MAGVRIAPEVCFHMMKRVFAVVSVVAAIQTIVACGEANPSISKIQAIRPPSATTLMASDINDPRTSWVVGDWSSEARDNDERREISISADPRQMIYTWYNAQVGSDTNPMLPPNPTYCSFRFTANSFKIQSTGPLAARSRLTPPANISVGLQTIGYQGTPFSSSTSVTNLTTTPYQTDGMITAQLESIELIDEDSLDDPGCQEFLTVEEKFAGKQPLVVNFVHDARGNLELDDWTLSRSN
jgi:hypothetical protein